MAKVKSDTKTTTNTKLFGRLSRCFFIIVLVSLLAELVFLPCSGEFRILDPNYRLDYDHGGCPTCGCSMLEPACNPRAKEAYNCLLFGDILDVAFLFNVGIVIIIVIYNIVRSLYIRHRQGM